MWCPKCCGKSKVIGTVTDVKVKRFRRCLDCGYTFPTTEAIDNDKYWNEYAKKILKDEQEGKNGRKTYTENSLFKEF